jgi:CheY-like chemotaxis protein
LVVDDNSDMREYIFKLLHHQYNVEVASDGLKALACVLKRIPELILSDVMMPNLDGFVKSFLFIHFLDLVY